MTEARGHTDGPPADAARLVDLIPWLSHPEVRRLLALSLHEPTADDVERLCRSYAHADTPRVVFGLKAEGRLVGVVGATAPQPATCEVLSLAVDPPARRRGYARRLVEAAAAALAADEIVADTDSEAVGFYRACGFALEPLGEAAPGVARYRARRAAGADDGEPAWFSAPRAHLAGDRDLRVRLPPGGNTLPQVPDDLADRGLPPFVVEWLLEAHEIGLMLQQLLPQRFPPTTPPIRPQRVRDFLGPVTTAAGLGGAGGGRAETTQPPDPEESIPGLPAGVELPMAVLEVAEMGQRLRAWIDKGQRVRAWAEANGHGDAPWIVPDLP